MPFGNRRGSARGAFDDDEPDTSGRPKSGGLAKLVRAANGEPAPPVVSVSRPKAVSIFDVELPQAAELLDRKRARDIARGKAKA